MSNLRRAVYLKKVELLKSSVKIQNLKVVRKSKNQGESPDSKILAKLAKKTSSKIILCKFVILVEEKLISISFILFVLQCWEMEFWYYNGNFVSDPMCCVHSHSVCPAGFSSVRKYFKKTNIRQSRIVKVRTHWKFELAVNKNGVIKNNLIKVFKNFGVFKDFYKITHPQIKLQHLKKV